MAKIKTTELTGTALDYAVAMAEGATDFRFDTVATYWVTLNGKDRALRSGWAQSYLPSTHWSHGGPIIDRERIGSIPRPDGWLAGYGNEVVGTGGLCPTALVAAMRAYVRRKLGDEVDVPDELLVAAP